MKKWILVVLFLPSQLLIVNAQNIDNQVWLEYLLQYPFANSYNLENALVYSTVAGDPKWKAYDYSPTLEYSLNQNIDFSAGATFSYTKQTETYNTFEIRPVLGTRIHLTPNRRVMVRVLARVESRNFQNLETHQWEKVIRPRFRVESLIPINKKSFFENKLWYAIADVEWLMAVDPDVQELFANRLRVRTGVGYRLNYSFRFEFIFMNQQSRDGINESLTSSDNIFRFRIKHFLRQTKPSKATDIGN